jgi:hypothetical protein
MAGDSLAAIDHAKSYAEARQAGSREGYAGL